MAVRDTCREGSICVVTVHRLLSVRLHLTHVGLNELRSTNGYCYICFVYCSVTHVKHHNSALTSVRTHYVVI
jgi:hypothetical protein